MGLKSIFDGIYVDQLIHKNERGDFVIYPYGLLGGGYALPAEREPAMRQRLRLLMLIPLVVSIAFGLFVARIADAEVAVSALGWVVIAAGGALLFAALIYYQRRLAIGLQPVDGPRPTAGQWLRGGRRSRPSWTHWFSIIVGLIMALLSVAAIGVGLSESDLFVIACGVFLLGLSVLAAWDGVLGLQERRRAS